MTLKDYGSALVTGASSGIGEAVVEALAARGLTIHAAARRGDRLQELSNRTGCRAHVLDLRDRQAVYAAFEDLEVDILINNAGLGLGFEALSTATPEEIDATLDTNLLAAAHVLRAVLPGMIARRRGHIVNIGSCFGLHAGISVLYGASKAAIHMMSQNLRLELRGTGIRVSEVCPGRAKTEFYDVALGDPERQEAMTSGFDILTSADIADAVVYALEAPWRVNIGLIELTATEQVFGGAGIYPVGDD